MSWTPEKIKQLKKLWQKKHGYNFHSYNGGGWSYGRQGDFDKSWTPYLWHHTATSYKKHIINRHRTSVSVSDNGKIGKTDVNAYIHNIQKRIQRLLSQSPRMVYTWNLCSFGYAGGFLRNRFSFKYRRNHATIFSDAKRDTPIDNTGNNYETMDRWASSKYIRITFKPADFYKLDGVWKVFCSMGFKWLFANICFRTLFFERTRNRCG